jgi:hypothetical protein
MKDNKINDDRIVTRTYSGPNRRVSEWARHRPHVSGTVEHAERANRKPEARPSASRKQYDEETINLLKILKIEA